MLYHDRHKFTPCLLYIQRVHYHEQRLYIQRLVYKPFTIRNLKARKSIFFLFSFSFLIPDWSATVLYMWGFGLTDYWCHTTTNRLVRQSQPILVAGAGATRASCKTAFRDPPNPIRKSHSHSNHYLYL